MGSREKNLRRLQKMCLSKVPHRSKLSAENALDQMTRLPNSVKLDIYSCPICKQFHIGNQNSHLIKKLEEDEQFKQSMGNTNNSLGSCNRGTDLFMEE